MGKGLPYYPPVPLILASASPRRADLLTAAGFAFVVRSAEVDESLVAGEAPEAYVRRLALAKAQAVAAAPGEVVLAADTAVVVDGEVLGKPVDADDAVRMLGRLSGRSHDVLTGVALVGDGRTIVEVARTAVRFHDLTASEMAWYAATGEPYDKAGGYAVQGLASRFVAAIEGSHSNVVGLPVDLVYRLLTELGVLESALDAVPEVSTPSQPVGTPTR